MCQHLSKQVCTLVAEAFEAAATLLHTMCSTPHAAPCSLVCTPGRACERSVPGGAMCRTCCLSTAASMCQLHGPTLWAERGSPPLSLPLVPSS